MSSSEFTSLKLSPKVDITILHSTKEDHGLRLNELTVNFDLLEFKQLITDDLKDEIESHWVAKCLKNQRLYNETKFRLHESKLTEEHNLSMDIGITSYKDHCGSNLSNRREHWLDKGLAEHGNSTAYMAQALGVGIILETNEGDILITRRALWTGEGAGKLDRPGGHPEPSKIFTFSDPQKPTKEEAIQTFKYKSPSPSQIAQESECQQEDNMFIGMAPAVKNEIWNSIQDEVEDEIGIARDHLQDLQVIGITFDNLAVKRCSLEFYARLDLSTTDVQTLYSAGIQAEADESTELLSLNPNVIQLVLNCLEKIKELSQDGIIGDIENIIKDFNKTTEFSDDDIILAKTVLTEATPALIGSLFLARPLLKIN